MSKKKFKIPERCLNEVKCLSTQYEDIIKYFKVAEQAFLSALLERREAHDKLFTKIEAEIPELAEFKNYRINDNTWEMEIIEEPCKTNELPKIQLGQKPPET